MARTDKLALFLKGEGVAPSHVTVQEIADDLRVHRNVIYQMVKDGVWKHIKVGGKLHKGVLVGARIRIPTATYLSWRKVHYQVGETPVEQAALAGS